VGIGNGEKSQLEYYYGKGPKKDRRGRATGKICAFPAGAAPGKCISPRGLPALAPPAATPLHISRILYLYAPDAPGKAARFWVFDFEF
jgi:hypothetical protein